jgi:hypothetical protein
MTKNGKNFKGFVKRVYGAGDPSVNHLIIVENLGTQTHSFSTYTNDDDHYVSGLSATGRIYYLLYAGYNGSYINNSQTQAIMSTFLNAIQEGNSWLSINKKNGTLAAGQSESLTATFNSANLPVGTYTTQINVTSNDPDKLSATIPVSMFVRLTDNHEPVALVAFEDQVIEQYSEGIDLNLAAYFYDQDGDALKYTASSSDESVVNVSILGSVLYITPVDLGETIVTVVSEDIWGDNVESSFHVQVTSVTDLDEELISGSVNAYPNPFSKATEIAYTLQREAIVQLIVFDGLGRTIDPLVNAYQQPGNHRVHLDGHNLQNGIYYFKLLVNNQVVHEAKMMKR